MLPPAIFMRGSPGNGPLHWRDSGSGASGITQGVTLVRDGQPQQPRYYSSGILYLSTRSANVFRVLARTLRVSSFLFLEYRCCGSVTFRSHGGSWNLSVVPSGNSTTMSQGKRPVAICHRPIMKEVLCYRAGVVATSCGGQLVHGAGRRIAPVPSRVHVSGPEVSGFKQYNDCLFADSIASGRDGDRQIRSSRPGSRCGCR